MEISASLDGYTMNCRLPAETDWETELEQHLPPQRGTRAPRSSFELPSTANTKSDGRGRTLTDNPGLEQQLIALLDYAWQEGFTVQSRYARAEHPELVAMAASLQLITTRVNRDVFSRTWQITAKGHRWLNEAKELS